MKTEKTARPKAIITDARISEDGKSTIFSGTFTVAIDNKKLSKEIERRMEKNIPLQQVQTSIGQPS